MKKFIISILCVSVFFIGLGGLVEKTSASFRSDARALELIRLARIAIGGEANIKSVRSMTITGTSAHTFNFNGATDVEQGNLEINFEFPGKFNQMSRIGNPGDHAASSDEHQDVEVVIVKKDGDAADLKDVGEGKKVVIMKKGDGTVLTEDIKPVDGQRRIIIKKDDGTVQELNPDDKDKVMFERKSGDGATAWKSKDGKNIIVDKDVKFIGAGAGAAAFRQNDMLRTTLSLLLTAPEGVDVSYKYAGEAAVDGTTCNVVEAETNGSKYKLYLDKTTNLPKMISYLGAPMIKVVKADKPVDGRGQKGVKVFTHSTKSSEMVEHQVKFSDFRSVGGLLLPHRWTKTIGGGVNETIEITNYEINPANIADKFQNEKVLIKRQKPQ